MDTLKIAVIGSRNPSFKSLEKTKKFLDDFIANTVNYSTPKGVEFLDLYK